MTTLELIKFPFTLSIHITQKDIASGVRGSCYRCPTALAGNRALKQMFSDDLRCVVSPYAFRVYNNEQYICGAMLPFAIINFIKLFDSNLIGQPLSAEIKLDASPI